MQESSVELHLLWETLGHWEDEVHAGEMERRRLQNTIPELKTPTP